MSGEFTAGTVYRARAPGWKRPVLAAAIVFGVTVTVITDHPQRVAYAPRTLRK
ncbi:hypothetical protein ACF1G5_07595 [Streptomyces coeruleorubidus]|uniref:hypothetical protein n=1 Tax=Streptomyces coeruleorubidus TaxID=116188 RepID=UPI0036FBA523